MKTGQSIAQGTPLEKFLQARENENIARLEMFRTVNRIYRTLLKNHANPRRPKTR